MGMPFFKIRRINMTKEFKASLSLLFVTVVWGGSFPIMSKGIKFVGVYTFLTFRFLLAAAILLIFCFNRFNKINKATIKAGIIIGLAMFIGSVLQTEGLLYTSPSKSGFVTGLNVVMVPIIIAIRKMKLPDIYTIMGVILSVIGLSLISLNGDFSFNYGDFLTMLCALAFAMQIIWIDKYAQNIDPLLLTLIEFLVIGILSLVPAVAMEKIQFTPNSFSIWAILYTSIFSSILAYGVQNKMQPFVSPSNAAIIYLAEPVFGAIFSVFVGDIITLRVLIGCVIIFLSMIVVNYKNIMQNKNIDKIQILN